MPPASAQRARGHRPSQSVNPRSSPAPLPPQPDDLAAPLASAPARGPRRQYAQNQAAYFAAEASTAALPPPGPPPAGGHARAASQAFFSPAAMMDPNGAPSPQPFAQDQQQFPYPNQQQPQQIPAYGQQPAPVAAISNQFSQMGISGQQNPAFQSNTTNLVGQPLNPAELFMMDPPEIRLPANVSNPFQSSPLRARRIRELRIDKIMRDLSGLVLHQLERQLRSIVSTLHHQRRPHHQFSTQQIQTSSRSHYYAVSIYPARRRKSSLSHSPCLRTRSHRSFLRSSLREFEVAKEMLTLVLYVQEPVPVVSDTVIARCRRCRTYINPFVTFIEGGHRWKCCMCNLSNEVPQLFDWDQVKNIPADRWKRSELNESVVEFVAPTEYMVSSTFSFVSPPLSPSTSLGSSCHPRLIAC